MTYHKEVPYVHVIFPDVILQIILLRLKFILLFDLVVGELALASNFTSLKERERETGLRGLNKTRGENGCVHLFGSPTNLPAAYFLLPAAVSSLFLTSFGLGWLLSVVAVIGVLLGTIAVVKAVLF